MLQINIRNLIMIKIIFITTTLLINGIANADVPNTFEAGEAIKASEMNENFIALDSKVEGIQSAFDIISNSVSTNAEFVGFTNPAIFGSLGVKLGRSMCPNLYPGSHICTISELENTNDWTGFDIASPFVLTIGDSNHPNPCNNFSNRNSDAGYGYTNGDYVAISDGSRERDSYQRISIDSFTTSGGWLINNTTPSTGFVNTQSTENSSVQAGTRVYFSVCNISIPAVCCK